MDAGALRVRSHIDRSGEGVAEIRLETMARRVAKHDLGGVVVALPDGVPAEEGGELSLVHLGSLRAAIVAVEVDICQRAGFPIVITVGRQLQGVDVLGST